MKTQSRIAIAFIAALTVFGQAHAANSPIAVVAAENFYGDVARQIGGDRVSVTSILNNPDQDPHLFETTPAAARRIAAAQVVIYNGAGYDSWIEKILNVTPRPGRIAIIAAGLMHKMAGDNPHLWYDPATMPAVADALAAALTAADPSHGDGYAARLKVFKTSLELLNRKIAAISEKFAGVPVTATEPVFAPMAAALKLTMRNTRFQLAVMNGTEPSARDIAALERDLRSRNVRVVFYNKQASNLMVQHLVSLARASRIPVVGVTETEPPGLSYQAWMQSELDATEKALAAPSS